MAVEALAEQIREHGKKRLPMRIVGGNSKEFYGQNLSSLSEISTTALDQVISYECSEMVLRVEAGCSLSVINEILRAENQMLAFEPPDFGGSTIGGAIASGIAGSRRPFAGAGRDFLLGVGIIDGAGDVFSFGGQVMKNVAGYDVSRLMAGAMGCLGLITEVSLKVLPMPELELSVSRSLGREEFLAEARRLTAWPEVTALAWWQNQIFIRYSGSEHTVKERVAKDGGDPLDANFWAKLDSLALFVDAKSVRRYSCKPMDKGPTLTTATLIDWAGAQRWVLDAEPQDEALMEVNSYSTLVKTDDPAAPRFAPLTPQVAALHRKLKSTFDPHGILNPNKMYEGF